MRQKCLNIVTLRMVHAWTELNSNTLPAHPQSGKPKKARYFSISIAVLQCLQPGVITRREHQPLRDFKDADASELVCSALSIFRNEHQNAPPVNHQQKCFMNRICSISDVKSNYFNPASYLLSTLRALHQNS